MKAVFRVDSSSFIGAGHVMRCLTLADELSRYGWKCVFVCRNLRGNNTLFIRRKGYEVNLIDSVNSDGEVTSAEDEYVDTSFAIDSVRDSEYSCEIIEKFDPDWIVVDHYGISSEWHTSVRIPGRKILVIDDLSDRYYDCDILLDQTFMKTSDAYLELVPETAHLLVGTDFALLRPEFLEFRDKSLSLRPPKTVLREVLIFMGGGDPENTTADVLREMEKTDLISNVVMKIVMSSVSRHLDGVRSLAADSRFATEVLTDVDNMAELMTGSDLAIGAAGSTVWERACLGLPSVIYTIADNQNDIARNIHSAGVAFHAGHMSQIGDTLVAAVNNIVSGNNMHTMTVTSSRIVDGQGVCRVAREMLAC